MKKITLGSFFDFPEQLDRFLQEIMKPGYLVRVVEHKFFWALQGYWIREDKKDPTKIFLDKDKVHRTLHR